MITAEEVGEYLAIVEAVVRIVPSSSTKRPAAARRQTSEYSLEVSDCRPKVGRGVRITVACMEAGSAGGSKPFLRLMDPQRGEYRTELRQGVNPGEWFWHSGLEVKGPWTGIAYIPTRRGLQTALLPTIEVQP